MRFLSMYWPALLVRWRPGSFINERGCFRLSSHRRIRLLEVKQFALYTTKLKKISQKTMRWQSLIEKT